jgi:hypothetical protein
VSEVTLFGHAEPTLINDMASESRVPRVLYATNRYNILENLSSRLCAPRAAFDKYYRDLLETAAGRVPLFADAVDADVVSACTSEGTASFPVLLELPASTLSSAKVESLAATGRKRKSCIGDAGVVAWAPEMVFALQTRAIVHFRTHDELEEHRAQQYENIRHEDWNYRVSSDLFNGTGGSKILSWMVALPGSEKLSTEQFRLADKEGGAIALLIGGADDCAAARAVGEKLLAANAAPYTNDYFSYVTDGRHRYRDRESLLFYAVIESLGRLDVRSFAATTLLEALTKAEVLDNLESADKEFVQKGLTHLRAVVDNEVEFTAFPDGNGSSVLRGLTLLVLRPDPKRITSWNRGEINAGDPPYVIALAFAGYLCGRKRLSAGFRKAELDDQLARRAAVRLGSGGAARVRKGSKDVDITELLARLKSASDDETRLKVSQDLAAAYGWTDCRVDEYVVPADNVKIEPDGTATVRIPKGSVSQQGFSEERFREHIRAQLGDGDSADD